MGCSRVADANAIIDKSQLVTDIMLSSVVPASVTGEDKVHLLTGLDLAMKLHYLRGVYFFDREAATGMTIFDLKEPMFDWLERYNVASGRIRVRATNDGGEAASRSGGSGLPFIKINDSGVRIVEARCEKTLEEWLGLRECCALSDELLVYSHALGPDLRFSPLVLIQITWFKCGGISMGLTWAHVLGDALSATAFMSSLGHFMRSDPPSKPLRFPDPPKPESRPLPPTTHQPVSLKRVSPVGTHWIAPTNTIGGAPISFRFHLTPKHIDCLHSSIPDPDKLGQVRPFELIAAAIWRSVARIRKNMEPKVVTVCRHRPAERGNLFPFNGSAISTAEATRPPSESDLAHLVAALAAVEAKDESGAIREFVEGETGGSDFILYGANLTLVDLEEADLYGFGLNGKKPVFANYTIGGVGVGGAVLVLPAPDTSGDCGGGRAVTVMLSEDEVEGLKRELL